MSEIKVGTFSGNVEACIKLGKAEFLAAHQHLGEPEAVWAEIEKAGKKVKPEPETEKK
jgi:hypothetical protein